MSISSVQLPAKRRPPHLDPSLSKKHDLPTLLFLAAIWVVMILLVNPGGDFPLNDDWAYARTVQLLIEDGEFQLSDWTATNLLSQVVWGALFSLPFGFSFTALRFSTLTLGLIGVLVTYGLLREVSPDKRLAFLGALLVFVNPIYLGLSHTFMSDVPFFAFLVLSLYFLLRGLRRDSLFEIVIGTIVACAAILDRQLGLAIPLSFGLAYLMKRGMRTEHFLKGLSPALIGFGVQFLYHRWLDTTLKLPALYNLQVNLLKDTLTREASDAIYTVTKNTFFGLLYVGLFAFPFLITLYPIKIKELSRRRRRLSVLVLSCFSVAVMGILMSYDRHMPVLGNVLTATGIGPMSVWGGYAPRGSNLFLETFWQVATAIAVLGAAFLLHYIFSSISEVVRRGGIERAQERATQTLLLCMLFFYVLPIGLLEQGVYDRYFLPLLPLAMMLACTTTTGISNARVGSRTFVVALLMTSFSGVFSVAATHDYLSWNRVRWQAIRDLTQRSRVTPEEVDGGFEFRGWHFGNRLGLCNPIYRQPAPHTRVSWEDFTCLETPGSHLYTISLVPRSGYQETERYDVEKWLPFGPANILVLRAAEQP